MRIGRLHRSGSTGQGRAESHHHRARLCRAVSAVSGWRGGFRPPRTGRVRWRDVGRAGLPRQPDESAQRQGRAAHRMRDRDRQVPSRDRWRDGTDIMRAHNEGSVFQLTSGKWRAQVSIGGGKYRTRTVATQALALKALRELTREQETGVVVAGHLTVADLLEEWRTKDEASSDRTRGTRSSNFGHLAAWHRTIGSKRVARVTVADVEDAMVAMSKGRKVPYSRETMSKRRSVLNQVFKAAKRRGRVTFNPAEHAVLPANAPRTEARRSFTVAQAEAIIRTTAPHRNGAAY